VEFIADARNLVSCAAIRKLGATQEGILRQHMTLENGVVRDSVMFSILKSEWPAIKENLRERIAKLS
jgi:RimJ/RimL family protein N-acetyltransferase